MNLTGKSLIAGEWLAVEGSESFTAYSPLDDKSLSQTYFNASDELLLQAAESAQEAFYQYAETSKEQRAEFLETVADQIMALGDDLLHLTHQETGLPIARLTGERGRTVNQLKLFAHYLRTGFHLTVYEKADPTRKPLPKPATRLEYLPVGPVAVFGASNFPYAFSTLGGDTASALAAGCPVIVKAHPAHPGTSELMAVAINKALYQCGLSQGIFSLLQSNKRELSHKLVQNPTVKAVGFTGSFGVAMSLQESIDKRQERIPLYGELGSINPQIVLPDTAQENAQDLATTLVESLVLGQGQFCTNPGLWLVPTDANQFLATAAQAIEQQLAGPLLTKGIQNSFVKGVDALNSHEGVVLLGKGLAGESFHARAHLFKTSAENFIQNQTLHAEVFGPCGLVVCYDSLQELIKIVDSLEGQLTASILGTSEEVAKQTELTKRLKHKVGRLIFNQMPTGVEVCYSMNHGGPYPSTTDVRATSVGVEAMKRFLRPICFQS